MTISPQMLKLGFTTAKPQIAVPRIITSVAALEKQGKTHFALTAPDPIAFINTDVGTEGVIEKFAHKVIYPIEIAREEGETQDTAIRELKRYKDAYHAALEEKSVRSIVVDTSTEIWELYRMAKFGQLTEIMPYMYREVNKEYRDMVRKAYSYNKNIIMLHKMKEEYVGKNKTGEYGLAGFKETDYLVQVNVRLYRYAPEDGGAFALYVKDCRQNPDIAGTELVDPMCSFPFLAATVLPDVDASHWG